MRGYNKPKFYRYEKRYKRYVVNKTIKSHAYYFGSYKTEEEAKARVKELEANGGRVIGCVLNRVKKDSSEYGHYGYYDYYY